MLGSNPNQRHNVIDQLELDRILLGICGLDESLYKIPPGVALGKTSG